MVLMAKDILKDEMWTHIVTNFFKTNKIVYKIQACGENALVKSFKMSPHMIYVLKGPITLYCGL